MGLKNIELNHISCLPNGKKNENDDEKN